MEDNSARRVRPIEALAATLLFVNLGVAAPLLDVLGKNAEFCVAHGASGAQIWLFALVWSLVVPLVVWGLFRFAVADLEVGDDAEGFVAIEGLPGILEPASSEISPSLVVGRHVRETEPGARRAPATGPNGPIVAVTHTFNRPSEPGMFPGPTLASRPTGPSPSPPLGAVDDAAAGEMLSCTMHYMSTPMSVRLPGDVRSRLEHQARVAHEPPARYAARVLDEGLRIAAHPGITFRSTPTGGRLAALSEGPDVVEVVRVIAGLEARGEDRVREAAAWLDLPERKVRLALDYYADFPAEVDAELELRDRAEAELVERFDRRRDLLG